MRARPLNTKSFYHDLKEISISYGCLGLHYEKQFNFNKLMDSKPGAYTVEFNQTGNPSNKIDWQIRKQFLLLWKVDNICKRCACVWRGDGYTLQSSLFLSGTIYLIFVLDKKYSQIIMKKMKTISFSMLTSTFGWSPSPGPQLSAFGWAPSPLVRTSFVNGPAEKPTSRVSKVRNKKN